MNETERHKIYAGMAEISRKWVSVMDTKAAFLSALNAGTLALIWIGLKLGEGRGPSFYLVVLATFFLLISLVVALEVVMPRTNFPQVFGKRLVTNSGSAPISFFGYVSSKYPASLANQFVADVDSMDEKAFAREQLEQHYVICHVVQTKSNKVVWSGHFWFVAALLATVSAILKGY